MGFFSDLGNSIGNFFSPDKDRVENQPAYNPALQKYIFGGGDTPGILPTASSIFRQGPAQYYPQNTIADFTGAEKAGQKALTQYATNTLPSMVSTGMGGIQDILSGGNRDPNMNNALATLMSGQGNPMLRAAGSGALSPYYQDVLTGTVNDLTRSYNTTTGNIFDEMGVLLNTADDSALLSGNFGGSRGEIARGIVGKETAKQLGAANQALSENMQQAASNVLNTQFSDARNAQLNAGTALLNSQLNAAGVGADLYGTDMASKINALGMLPSMGAMGLTAGQTLSDVGLAQRELAQAKINADMEKWNFNQNRNWANLGNYMNAVGGVAPYTGMNTVSIPGSGGGLPGMIGGGLAGFAATGGNPLGIGAGMFLGGMK